MRIIQILIYGILMKRSKRRDKDKEDTSEQNQESSLDDIDFILWKIELNTELLSFWKSIEEINKEKNS